MNIEIQRNAQAAPTDFSWQMGLGNCHAYLLHRTDMCEHIRLAHDELGIRYLRCHDVLDDDMLTRGSRTEFRRESGMKKEITA